MTEYKRCKKCYEVTRGDSCPCVKWVIWFPDDEYLTDRYAIEPGGAVVSLIEESDWGHEVIDDSVIAITVGLDGAVKQFTVTAEAVIEYSADEDELTPGGAAKRLEEIQEARDE